MDRKNTKRIRDAAAKVKDIHTYVGDEKIIALLKKYHPNVTFAELRAAMAGAIFSVENIMPSAVFEHVFGEEDAPKFKNEKEVKDWYVSMMSFWNELTKYQDPDTPFTFMPWPSDLSMDDSKQILFYAEQLEREIQYFLDGLCEGGVPFKEALEEESPENIKAWTPALLEVSHDILHEQMKKTKLKTLANRVTLVSLPAMLEEKMKENHANFVANIRAWRAEAMEESREPPEE